MGEKLTKNVRLSINLLDKVPEHAILNEAGDIAKDLGHQGVTKFVNGVLRNVIRKGVPSIDAIKDPVQKIAVETSLPEWLAKKVGRSIWYRKTA